MSLVREFATFREFTRFIETRAAVIITVQLLVTAEAAKVLERKTKAQYGSKVLADLAQATQDERVRLGYSANEPLKRTGELLRDSIHSEFGEEFAACGTDEPIAEYHEFGYVNARTGTAVPPRPAFKLGMEESLVPVMAIMEDAVGVQLGFKASLSSNIESGETSYAADVGSIERL